MKGQGFFVSLEDMQKLESLFYQFEQFVSTIYEQPLEDDFMEEEPDDGDRKSLDYTKFF